MEKGLARRNMSVTGRGAESCRTGLPIAQHWTPFLEKKLAAGNINFTGAGTKLCRAGFLIG